MKPLFAILLVLIMTTAGCRAPSPAAQENRDVVRQDATRSQRRVVEKTVQQAVQPAQIPEPR